MKKTSNVVSSLLKRKVKRKSENNEDSRAINNSIKEKKQAQDTPKQVSFDFADESLKSSSNASTSRRGSVGASVRRDNLDQRELLMGLSDLSADFLDLVLKSKGIDWLKSLSLRDPRYNIKLFFDDVAKDGANKIEDGIFQPELLSPLIAMFQRSSVFSVWRPTSIDSISKMMRGHGVGKGLDIKGKSAKKGKLSAYVPFLQIHQDDHKTKIRPLPSGGTIRVFYKKEAPRDKAYEFLMEVMNDMLEKVDDAKTFTVNQSNRKSYMETESEFTLANFRENSKANLQRGVHRDIEEAKEIIVCWEMDNPTVTKIDEYSPKCYGLEMPKRLFWEGYVMRAQDISRPPGSDFETGRPSTPGFQDMNFGSIKDKFDPDSPRAVVWQYTDPYQPRDQPDPDPMLPQTLLVAYEENGRVLPVVSDFDCFLLGTRGIRYETPLPKEQVSMVLEMIDDTEQILDDCTQGKSKSWTASWFANMKSKTTHHTMPKYGFGDPKSYEIMRHAVKRLEEFGAVRHGAECFNYYFPQDLDDEYLVIGGNLEGAKYKYMKLDELQTFLMDCIDKGFTFPLNPKWVLCDKGWKAIWDKLLASSHPNVQSSINVWCPPDSGIRERIEAVCEKYPTGYEPKTDIGETQNKKSVAAAPHLDEAEFALESYHRVQRAKRKFLVVLMWISILQKSQEKVLEKKAKQGAGGSKENVENPKTTADLLHADVQDDQWEPLHRPLRESKSRVTIGHTNISSYLGDDDDSVLERDTSLLKSLLQNCDVLTPSQHAALKRTINTVENRSLLKGLRMKSFQGIPSPILQEYGGAATYTTKSLKSTVKKLITSRKFIQMASKNIAAEDDSPATYLPPEWKRLDQATKETLAKKLSFKSLSSWDFNALEIAELCNCAPLLFIGWAILGSPHAQRNMARDAGFNFNEEGEEGEGYDFVEEFQVKLPVLCAFLRLTESNYNPNPYHNSTHAADVLATTNSILQLGGKNFAESNLHMFSLLVAAIIHDVQHPGLNNNFQINSQSDVAIQYNDVSVLENMSIAWFFSKVMGPKSDCSFNIFSGLNPAQFSIARCIVVKSILGTDMSHHFQMVADIDNHAEHLTGAEPSGWFDSYSIKGCTLHPSLDMLCFILHLADISNPAKPHPLFLIWADAVLAEFYAQGDKEASMGLPISPLCDRTSTSKKMSQVGFIKFVVKPAFVTLGSIISEANDVIIPCIEKSLEFWENYNEEIDANGASN